MAVKKRSTVGEHQKALIATGRVVPIRAGAAKVRGRTTTPCCAAGRRGGAGRSAQRSVGHRWRNTRGNTARGLNRCTVSAQARPIRIEAVGWQSPLYRTP